MSTKLWLLLACLALILLWFFCIWFHLPEFLATTNGGVSDPNANVNANSNVNIDEISAKHPQFKDRIRREGWIESAKEEHFKKYGERL